MLLPHPVLLPGLGSLLRNTPGICFLVLLSAFCLWKYAERLTPMERLHSGNFSLEQLQREKCVIITDLCEIKKAELWEDFIKKVKHASDAKVRVLFVYSGEKEGSKLKGTVLQTSKVVNMVSSGSYEQVLFVLKTVYNRHLQWGIFKTYYLGSDG